MVQTENWAPARAPISFPSPDPVDRSRPGLSPIIRVVRVLPLLLSALSLQAGSKSARSRAGRLHPRAMLLVTIDTWRWDALGAAGRTSIRTPALDALAGQGYYIRQAYTPAPLTSPAHASIITGLLPYRHGVRDNLHYRLADGVRTLAEDFHIAGFATAAFVSATPLRKGTGFNRGFEHYDDGPLRLQNNILAVVPEREAELTINHATAWLDALPAGRGFFLWLHLYDPHFPYRDHVRPPGTTPPPNAYAGEVEYVDAVLAPLLRKAKARYAAGGLRILVVGDHGEALGDHGEPGHGIGLYESTVAVPLILWPREPGRRIRAEGPVSLVDLAPTLRDWNGLPATESDGRSLFRAGEDSRWLYAEAMEPTIDSGVTPAYSLRRGRFVAMLHGGREVYDTQADPGQTANQVPGSKGENFYASAETKLREILVEHPEAAIRSKALTADPETVEKMQALGYIGSGRVDNSRPWLRDDRRQYIRRFRGLMDARDMQKTGHLEEAERGYLEFLGYYPDTMLARLGLARVRVKQGRLDEAEQEYTRAAESDPADAGVWMDLGNVAQLKRDFPGARRHYQHALELDPDNIDALYNLYQAEISAGNPAAAIPWARRFLLLAPGDPAAAGLREWLQTAGRSEPP
jgi:arylsulfatase A-like enzyme